MSLFESFPPTREEPFPAETTKVGVNFWLLVTIIIVLFILILFVIFFVFAPINTIKTDVSNISTTVESISPKADKLISNGQSSLSLVDKFINTAQADLTKISDNSEQILSNTETLVKTAQTDLQNAIFDFCNFTSIKVNDDTVSINFREAFPTLCRNVPQPVTSPPNEGRTLGSNPSRRSNRLISLDNQHQCHHQTIGNCNHQDFTEECPHAMNNWHSHGVNGWCNHGVDEGYSYGVDEGFEQEFEHGYNAAQADDDEEWYDFNEVFR